MCLLKDGNLYPRRVVDIVPRSLNALRLRAKDRVEQSTLFAVVVALLPSSAMMQVVVFNDELHIEVLEERCDGQRWRTEGAQPAVSKQFDENDVFITDPRLVKAHWHAHALAGVEGKHWDDDNVEKLLPAIGVQRQQRIGMFRQMMGSMKLPKPRDIVHGSVVPVEPKVNHERVHGLFDKQPTESWPGKERIGCLRGVPCEKIGHYRTSHTRHQKRRNDFLHTNVGDAIARMLVAVQVAVLVPQVANDLDLTNGSNVEPERIEKHRPSRCQVLARIQRICVMNNHGHASVGENPFVHLSQWHIGDLVCLFKLGNWAIEVGRMYAQNLEEPVPYRPLLLVATLPGRLYRVFGVAHHSGGRSSC